MGGRRPSSSRQGPNSTKRLSPSSGPTVDPLPSGAPSSAPVDPNFAGRRRGNNRSGTSPQRAALHVESVACSILAEADPQLLGFSYWFEAAKEGKPYPINVRFSGRRLGVVGKSTSSDRFSIVESIDHVVPGSGPIALTARVREVTSGQWEVTAAPVSDGQRLLKKQRDRGSRPALPKASSEGQTGFSPVILGRAPGAHVGAWPTMVGLGFIVGLGLQGIVAHHLQLAWTRFVLLALIAAIVGLAGAKIYYLTGRALAGRKIAGWKVPGERAMVSQGPSVGGMCIQGFVIGAILVVLLGASAIGEPAGVVLDVTTPGLLFGMTIGRFGCFFGGCCAGRLTASRWGLWSSDRRIGARRVPTQLFESALAGVLGAIALTVLWNFHLRPPGVVFVAAIASYTLGRQFLFSFRDRPRHTTHGRNRMLVIAGAVIAVDVAIAIHG